MTKFLYILLLLIIQPVISFAQERVERPLQQYNAKTNKDGNMINLSHFVTIKPQSIDMHINEDGEIRSLDSVAMFSEYKQINSIDSTLVPIVILAPELLDIEAPIDFNITPIPPIRLLERSKENEDIYEYELKEGRKIYRVILEKKDFCINVNISKELLNNKGIVKSIKSANYDIYTD